MKILVDGSGIPLGRLASYAAKQALLGKEVIILNSSKVIITGERRMIIKEYQNLVVKGGHALNGPFWIKRNPERLVKRTIRGMLSYRQQRGLSAFKRILCYNEEPAEYKPLEKVMLAKPRSQQSITMAELAREL